MMSLGIFAGLFVLASAQSGAGYDKYMKQYAGDYSQHMSQGGSAGSAGDYGNYMKQYAGSYMGQGGSDSSAGGAGNYMKQYAGDYSKYMSQGSADSPSPAATLLLYKGNLTDKDVNDMWKDKYASKYLPKIHNMSDQNEVQKAFASMYAGDYAHYITMQNQNQGSSSGYSQYTPAIHNMSDQKEVAKAYEDKYAGAYKKYIQENAANSSKRAEAKTQDKNQQRLAGAESIASKKVSSASQDSDSASDKNGAAATDTSKAAAEKVLLGKKALAEKSLLCWPHCPKTVVTETPPQQSLETTMSNPVALATAEELSSEELYSTQGSIRSFMSGIMVVIMGLGGIAIYTRRRSRIHLEEEMEHAGAEAEPSEPYAELIDELA